jgi:hypothetical protein
MNTMPETSDKPSVKNSDKPRLKTSGKPSGREALPWYTCAAMVF